MPTSTTAPVLDVAAHLDVAADTLRVFHDLYGVTVAPTTVRFTVFGPSGLTVGWELTEQRHTRMARVVAALTARGSDDLADVEWDLNEVLDRSDLVGDGHRVWRRNLHGVTYFARVPEPDAAAVASLAAILLDRAAS